MRDVPPPTLRGVVTSVRELIGPQGGSFSLSFSVQQITYMSQVYIDDGRTQDKVKSFDFTYVADVSYEAFLDFVKSKKKVSVQYFKAPGGLRSNAYSLAFRVGDSYIILIDENASRCKLRFGIVKELFHIHCNFFLPIFTREALEKAIIDASACIRRLDFNRELTGEEFCYLCALEFFVPRLNGVRNATIDLKSFPHTDYTIAQSLRIPLSAATFLFDGNPSYIAASNRIHEALDESSM